MVMTYVSPTEFMHGKFDGGAGAAWKICGGYRHEDTANGARRVRWDAEAA